MLRLVRIAGAVALAGLVAAATAPAFSASPTTRVERLRLLADRFEQKLETRRSAAFWRLVALERRAGIPSGETFVELAFLGPRGKPFYRMTENVDAAETVNTDHVHPGGGFGFGLTGSATALGQLAIWDGGAVRTSHQEFGGRATQMDGAGSNSSHATHVSGTMIAAGVNANAKGMSYEGRLACYDWNSDDSEMATAGGDGLRISNHSYGFVTGWRFGYTDPGEWNWFGDITISTVEDYGFGFYWDGTRDWDQIAHDAPYYLICASAGNDRNDFGPGPGGGHYVWDDGQWVWSTETRDPDGGDDGYDCISWNKVAKNMMTVGAIADIPGGWTDPSDVSMSTFSGWGPTDDGRIKPDLVANGIGLFSSTASGNSTYDSFSGTSMASPNLSGSANLVADYFAITEGNDPTSAMLKAILIHTANEAGSDDGPDYEHGWGVLNTLGAVQLIEADGAAPGHLTEAALANGGTDDYWFLTDAPGEYRLTIVWTDPPGTPPADALNPPDPMLVNDLDVRLTDVVTAATWEPWILNPADPAAAATTGDNFRDNVEQIRVASLPAGGFRVEVTHKGALDGGFAQAYALVSSEPLSTDPLPTGADDVAVASAFRLRPEVRPNPFAGTATISFDLAERAEVSVLVFDVTGRLVRTLERDQAREAGRHSISWDGRDTAGRELASGVYFARVESGRAQATEKLVLRRE